MAKLRGGSTVGGKQLVTLDIMNEFIYQIQTAELKDKMRKAEFDVALTDFSTADTYVKDRNKNGLWEMRNAINNDGKYNYGGLMNFSNNLSRFQIYAPGAEANKSAMYFRTGWENGLMSWERVATKTMLDTGLNLKYDKTGGDITGTITSTGMITSKNALQVTDNGSQSTKITTTATKSNLISTSGITGFTIDKRLDVTGEIYSNTKKVWHEGNLTPADYIPKVSVELAINYNINNLKTPGFFRCSKPVNSHEKVSNSWNYIEVIVHSPTYVLQKTYNYDGTYSFWRTLNNNVWTTWKTLGGSMSYKKDVATANWATVDGIYEMTITHDIGSENITSVIVTDTNKISMFTGFQVLSSTMIKVFCSSNPAGKVVINAIQ